MDTQKPNRMIRPSPSAIDTSDRRSRVVAADFIDGPPLAVDDDFDLGGDPYNSTGRHVIIKSRLNLED